MEKEQKEQKEYQKKLLIKIILIILVLVIAGCVSFCLAQKINKKRDFLVKSRNEIETIRKQGEIKVKLNKEYKQVEPYLTKTENFLTTKEELVKIIASLENIAAQTNCKQEVSMNYIKSYNEKEGIKEMNYTVSIVGNYDNFLEYCKKFEKLPIFIKMDSVEMLKMDKENLSELAKIIFKTSFYIKDI